MTPKMKVLVVDDSDDFIRTFALWLRQQRDVELIGTARDGEEGVELARQLDPDVVLMDAALPVMDGFTATRLITTTGRASVIVLTLEASPDARRAAAAAGARAVVAKEDLLTDLLPTMRTVVAPQPAAPARPAAAAASAAGEAATGTSSGGLLAELTRAVAEHDDRDTLFGRIAELIAGIVPFDFLGIAILDRATDSIVPYFVKPALDLPRVPFESSVLGELFRTGKPVVVREMGDLVSFPASRDLRERLGFESCVAVPLVVRRVVRGALVLFAKQPGAYDQDTARRLTDVAPASAVALLTCLLQDGAAPLEAESPLEAASDVSLDALDGPGDGDFPELIARSEAMRRVLRQVKLVAPTHATVLVTGETGCGKELIARAIHHGGSRAKHPLVSVNCAAISAGLLESELFGHEQGAFTGALRRHRGKFEQAHRGTIFLDEVAEMPLEGQAKLLRVLQERTIERVGGSEAIQVDVRVIAATNRDLMELVSQGRFREDLFFRLNVFPIRLPPLRERIGDVPLLAQYFAERVARSLARRQPQISAEALQRLTAYEWPGNVRELQNVIERAMIVSTGAVLEVPSLLFLEPRAAAAAPVPGASAPPADASMGEVERSHVLRILGESRWRIEGDHGAAKRLGLHPNTLRSRLKKWGIKRPGGVP